MNQSNGNDSTGNPWGTSALLVLPLSVVCAAITLLCSMDLMDTSF